MRSATYLTITFIISSLCLVFAQGQQINSGRLFTFEENDLRGYADATGRVVIEPQFPLAWEFSEDLARVHICTRKGFREGFIDRTGRIVIEPQFRDVEDFSGGWQP